ncbi:MAG: iron permease [Verrucomicrobia bacterium]|nr:iron permease [Verrucomicrobiota bacterium]
MFRWVLLSCVLAVGAVLVWQGVTTQGAPDPVASARSPGAALVDIGVLVFREGLECILVLAAITAGMVGSKEGYKRPVVAGAGVGFLATLITWCVAVAVVESLSDNIPALDLQAATGLLAVVVLLVVMNWFFHKVYWGGWITLHNRRRKELLSGAERSFLSERRLMLGLGLLGFSSFYREGFEVVLFLQSYRLQLGNAVVLAGTLVGVALSAMAAVLTFVAHRRLPYRKMLVLTGIMLGGVLIVMVGEQAQEMQLAHWLPTTEIKPLAAVTPPWLGTWFAVFPTVETLAGQLLAASLVIGSYFLARRHTAGTAQTADAT